MAAMFALRLLRLAPALLLLLVLSSSSGQANDKADAALKRLQTRHADPQVNRNQLRQEVLVFRRDFPGTMQAVKAAALLVDLPSPLDALDPAKIPPLERFDWQPKQLVAVLAEHRGRHGGYVAGVACTPDGQHVYSGGSSYVRRWDPTTMRLNEVIGPSSTVYGLAITPDGHFLAAAAADGTVNIWNISGDKAQRTAILQVATTPTYAVAFSADGKHLATASGDGQLRWWDGPWQSPPKEPIAALLAHSKAAMTVACAPDNKHLASGGLDGDIRLWDHSGATPRELHTLKEHGTDGKGVLSVAFDPTTGREPPLLASSGEDGRVRLWRLGVGRPKIVGELASKNGPIPAVTFAADGRTLAYAEGDWSVRLLDVVSRKERATLKGHAAGVTSLAFTPKDEKSGRSQHLISGSNDWTTRMWDDVTGAKPTQRTVTVGHLSAVYTASFPPDYRSLATGSEDKTVHLWDLAAAASHEKAVLRPERAVYSVAYLPDGKRLALAGATTVANLWDTEARKEVQSFKGHESVINSLMVSSDGKQLVTGSSDKTMRLWDVATGKEQRKFGDHLTPVICAAISPDGRHAASGSGSYLYDEKGQIVVKNGVVQFFDTRVRLWELPNGKEPRHIDTHTAWIYDVAFSPDNQVLASGSADLTLRLNPLAGGKDTAYTFNGHIWSIAFSPDGRLLATVGSDARVIIRDAGSGKELYNWVFHEMVRRVTFAGDGRHVAVTLYTGVVYVLRLAKAAE
jgi:WD40 repeat protein